MNFSKFFLSAVCIASMGAMASCQSSEEEPVMGGNSLGKDEVAYTVKMTLPDDFRTRAAGAGVVGSDGLYSFERDIDRLWYAVYYDNQLLYHSEQPLSQKAVKTANGFSLVAKFHKDLDPTKIYFFFWAGNTGDNVSIANSFTTSGINLNFADRNVTVDPSYINGGGELAEYDSFAGYFQLSATKDVVDYNLNYTLKRPFCQIHILTDEFTFAGVSAAFPNGVTAVPGFGRRAATATTCTSDLVAPTTWYYDESITAASPMHKGEFNFTQNNYEFTNTLKGTAMERVTFKERTMDYVGCFYVFAPQTKQQIVGSLASGDASAYTRFNIAFRKVGQNLSDSEFASITLPSSGLKANERYVVYNKKNYGPDDPDNPNPDPENPGGGEGDGGFLSDNYSFEIVTAPGWDNTSDIVKE